MEKRKPRERHKSRANALSFSQSSSDVAKVVEAAPATQKVAERESSPVSGLEEEIVFQPRESLQRSTAPTEGQAPPSFAVRPLLPHDFLPVPLLLLLRLLHFSLLLSASSGISLLSPRRAQLIPAITKETPSYPTLRIRQQHHGSQRQNCLEGIPDHKGTNYHRSLMSPRPIAHIKSTAFYCEAVRVW